MKPPVDRPDHRKRRCLEAPAPTSDASGEDLDDETERESLRSTERGHGASQSGDRVGGRFPMDIQGPIERDGVACGGRLTHVYKRGCARGHVDHEGCLPATRSGEGQRVGSQASGLGAPRRNKR